MGRVKGMQPILCSALETPNSCARFHQELLRNRPRFQCRHDTLKACTIKGEHWIPLDKWLNKEREEDDDE